MLRHVDVTPTDILVTTSSELRDDFQKSEGGEKKSQNNKKAGIGFTPGAFRRKLIMYHIAALVSVRMLLCR